METRTVGIDIGCSLIKAVQVSQRFRGNPKVTAAEIVNVGEHEDLSKALERLRENLAFRRGHCHVNFPIQDVSFRHVILPFTDRKKIDQTLAYELEPQLPFSLDGAVVDYLLRTEGDQGKILAAVAERSRVSERVLLLENRVTSVDVVDIDGFPVLFALMEKNAAMGEGLLLDVGGKNATGLFFAEGRVIQVRRFGEMTGGDEARRDNGALLAAEIKRSAAYLKWNGDMNADLAEVYVTGGGAMDASIRQALAETLDLSVTSVDLGALAEVTMDGTIEATWQPLLMNQALALALRRRHGRTSGFNLRPLVSGKDKHPFRDAMKNSKWIAGAVAACVVLAILEFYLDYTVTTARVSRLKSEIAAILRQSGIDAGQMKAVLMALQKPSPSVGEISLPGRALDVLRDISTLPPHHYRSAENKDQPTQFSLQNLTYDGDKVILKGESADFAAAQAIKTGLSRSRYFSAVAITSSRAAKGGNRVEFEMQLTMKRSL